MLTFEDLRQALQSKDRVQWEPQRDPIFPPGSGAGSGRFGLRLTPTDRQGLQVADEAEQFRVSPPPPPRVDWREADGVTPVKFQGDCGACVAFATCGAMESAHLILTKESLNLSEAHLFFCNGGDCEDGWHFVPALEAARTIGVGVEADFPYRDQQTACLGIEPRLQLSNWRRVLSRRDRQNAIARAPVIGGLQIFEDFAYYRSGIYRHVTGAFEGNHAVLIVGYDNDEEYWICKNSWSERFGEDGYFRIAFGECELDDANPFFAVDLAR